jgi:hypothetical protein
MYDKSYDYFIVSFYFLYEIEFQDGFYLLGTYWFFVDIALLAFYFKFEKITKSYNDIADIKY